MANNAITTATVWSPDPAALRAARAHAAGPPGPPPPAPVAGGQRRRPGWVRRLAGLRPSRADPPARRSPPVGHPFSLEAVVPTGMDVDAWDQERATALWGCGRPELGSSVVELSDDRVVYEVLTAYAPPDVALQTLSLVHPGVVVHAVTTCESEYAWTAWFVGGRVVDQRELALDLTDEQWEEWDGEWDLPAGWTFDVTTAQRLAGGASAGR